MSKSNADRLMSKVKSGVLVLMDGALGTELERRGANIDSGAWSALAVRDNGGLIKQIHQDYIQAGAQLHITNSFALSRHVLEPVGLGDDFEYLNRRSVELFNEAVVSLNANREDLWLAGSLSTFAVDADRSLLPEGDELVQNYRDQAQVLFDAGVDLFTLEMLFDVDVSLSMLRALNSFDLPVIMGFTCIWSESEKPEIVAPWNWGSPMLTLDQILTGVIDAIDRDNVILAIMHSEADVTDSALALLRSRWEGPVAIYPNSGEFMNLRMQFDSVCSVEEFQHAAQIWLNAGVQIVGGCCGIGPAHIQGLANRLGLIPD